MRIVNYRRGYSDFFDCSIHGRIIVTNDEWGLIRKHIEKYAFDTDDFIRFQSVRGGRWYNIRTTATDKLVKYFSLEKYRRGNYVIEVIN